ncbi:uncharacterized protein [Anabrus simplex]|uniref:uncharacterized protein n=1 Tax=Anabrus simplex TaxID=316456 RepID=UPI0035A2D18D
MALNDEGHKFIQRALNSLELDFQISHFDVQPFSQDNIMVSSLFEINIQEQRPSGEKRTRKFIAKLMRDIKYIQELFSLNEQFYNECRVYNEVIPLFIKSFPHQSETFNILPGCLYASFAESNSLLIVEHLTDYTLGNVTDMDYDHCSLALKALAQFHSFSYALKKQDSGLFHSNVALAWKEARYREGSHSEAFINIVTKVFGSDCVRTVKDIFPEFARKYETKLNEVSSIVSKPIGSKYRKLVQAEGPFAVLCHGDFNRNNILFRYDEDGKPCEVKLVDFQTVRYASPAIDISFILYLNTTSVFRATHEENLLSYYHQKVLESTASLLQCTVEELKVELSLEEFKSDYRRHALYGFLNSMIFTRRLLASPKEVEELEKKVGNMTEERAKEMLSLGGKFVKERIAEMLRDFLAKDYQI